MARRRRPDPSAPSSKTGGFTAQVQRCCVAGCGKPGTQHHKVSPRGAAALTTPPDQWADEWMCEAHYEEKYGDGNPAIVRDCW